MQPQDLYWKQYEKHIELYKFYIDAVIKLNGFHYLISSGIVGFYFAGKVESLALLLPAFFGVVLAIYFLYGAILNNTSRNDVGELASKMKLDVFPELNVLFWLLIIFAITNFLVSIPLGYLAFFGYQ